MNFNLNNRALLGASIFSLACAMPSVGQDEQQDELSVQDTVYVTALKRETALADTPLAVSVLAGEALEDAGVNSVVDLQNVAPSVQIDRSDFGVTINIRGVTTTDNTSKGSQGVAFNVDGVTIGRPREIGSAFFDVERVEVLRGPQGTLYGKSTTGGVVNVITKRPEFEFGGKLSAEYGNFDTVRLNGAMNLPVTDKLALRGAIAFNERDGYLPTNDGSPDFSDQDDLSFRLSGVYDFSDTTSLFLTTSFGDIGGVGAGRVPVGNFIPVGTGIAANEIASVSLPSGDSGRTVVGVPAALQPDVDEEFANLTAEFVTEFNGIEFTYLGGHREYDTNTFSADSVAPGLAAGPPPQPLVWDWGQYRGETITDQHELRLANAEPGRLNWVVGLNWHREETTESDHRWSSPVTNPTREAGISGINVVNTTELESSGIFGQFDYALTDRLNMTLGARYSDDEVTREGTFATGPFQVDADGNPCVFPNDCIGGPNNASVGNDKVTWRAGLDFKPSETSLFYGSIATGYKAGGFNDFDPMSGGPGPYDPEELVAYELGYKGRILPDLAWDSALFFYDYSSAQIDSLTNVNGSIVLLTRIAEIEISGWENDFVWTPTDDDTLKFGFSLMDSEYKDFTAGARAPGAFPPVGAVFTDWSGRDIDKVSDLTLRFEYLRDWTLPNGATLSARFASRYDSGYTASNFTDAIQLEQDSFTRSDANLTYKAADGNYDIGVFVRNLEDEVQIQNAPIGFPPGAENTSGVAVTEPQVYGVRLGLDF